jgi:hypothetical protein
MAWLKSETVIIWPGFADSCICWYVIEPEV